MADGEPAEKANVTSSETAEEAEQNHQGPALELYQWWELEEAAVILLFHL